MTEVITLQDVWKTYPMGEVIVNALKGVSLTNKTKDFSATSAKAQQQAISDITSTLTLFLGAIAAVSLIVGAIGIANTMFTSVLEKTKEIGIMKAIGAKKCSIGKIGNFYSLILVFFFPWSDRTLPPTKGEC